MSDLLQALYKERSVVADRIYMMRSYIESPNEVKSKTPYTSEDVKKQQQRLDEVNVAITAILKLRKDNDQPNNSTAVL